MFDREVAIGRCLIGRCQKNKGGVNGESPPSSTAKSAARVEFMDVEADRAGGTAGSSARPYYTDDNIDHAVSHAADELGLCEHVRKVDPMAWPCSMALQHGLMSLHKLGSIGLGNRVNRIR